MGHDRGTSEHGPAGWAHIDHRILGIDVGGTSMKAAVVDTHTGKLLSDRHIVPTPIPATPEAMAPCLASIVKHFDWRGAVGVGMPCVARQGRVLTAANLDPSWIGTEVEALLRAAMGAEEVCVMNDADAAGYAEMGFGTGKGNTGLVVLVTFGTGIGTALFINGVLVPNSELGHIEIDGQDAERLAAGVLREREGLSWEEWACRAGKYLAVLERLVWPELIIVGGGVSNAAHEWAHLVQLPGSTPVRVASMRNDAGIVGAALGALARIAGPNLIPPLVDTCINA